MPEDEISRRQLVRAGAAIAGGGALVAFLAGCGDDDDASPAAAEGDGDPLSKYKADGVKLGMAILPPFVIQSGSEVTGDTPEIARAILKNLGIDDVDTVTVSSFDGLIPGLQARRFDIIASGLAINKARCQTVRFSEPYVCAYPAWVVLQGNPKGLDGWESAIASDATVGILAGGEDVQAAKEAGMPADKIQSYPDIPAGLKALTSGRIDAFASDNVSLPTVVKESKTSGVEVLPNAIEESVGGHPVTGCAGFAFRMDDEALQQAFNEQLTGLAPDETAAIGGRFGIPKGSYEQTTEQTTKELCG